MKKENKIACILTDIAIVLRQQGIKNDKYFTILESVRKDLEK